MNFKELVLAQAEPISEAEALSEAQAWGFPTVEEFHAYMAEAEEEFQREMREYRSEA